MKIGYFLSSEEFGPRELIHQGEQAEQAGFHGLWISDHFHPWLDEQGHSSFVWSVIGALSQATSRIGVMTAVTCPTRRIQPVVIAQAAATSAVLLEGRFAFGVGSGEALNEHIVGGEWPQADVRLEMLEEAVALIRALWQGEMHSHRGRHYQVQNARIYDLPEELPPIIVSGFGPKATLLAARIGDGYCTVKPDAEAVARFREHGGKDRTVAGGMKVCWDEDEQRARRTAHRLWRSEQLPGELAQLLPTPAHFAQATELVSEDLVAEAIVCGPDLERHLEAIEAYAKAGFDDLYIQQVGGNHERFFEFYATEILPRFGNGEAMSATGAARTAGVSDGPGVESRG